MLQYWLAQLTPQPPQLLLFSSSFPPWLPMIGTQPQYAHPGLPSEPFQGLIFADSGLAIFHLSFSSNKLLLRSKLPPMAVLTPHSITPSQWTASVTWPELQRLVTLATTSMTNLNPHPIAIFKPNLECYEALIHIRPLQVPHNVLS